MKKSDLTIPILAFVFCFLVFWFRDMIYAYIWILAMIPLIIAVGMMVLSLVFSGIRIYRDPKLKKNIAGLVISILTVLMVLVFPLRRAKVALEFPILEAKRLQIVEMVDNGQLQHDGIGNAVLPEGYRYLSSDGNVYIRQNDQGKSITFWIYRGMLDGGSTELIYTTAGTQWTQDQEPCVVQIIEIKENWYYMETDG